MESETSRTVLVVDDSQMVRKQVGKTLTDAGFSVVEAVDGFDALQKLAETPATDLVVCDVNMPRMSGIEFLASMRALVTRPIAVLMLTTEGEPELIQRARALGAKGWLVKPFKPELLLAAAKKILA